MLCEHLIHKMFQKKKDSNLIQVPFNIFLRCKTKKTSSRSDSNKQEVKLVLN